MCDNLVEKVKIDPFGFIITYWCFLQKCIENESFYEKRKNAKGL